jgi:hypothetical protein
LGNQSTSLHFHGLFMNGSTHMDGPVQVSQCTIAPGTRFTYDFEVRHDATAVTEYLLKRTRSINQAPTGITHTIRGNIPMV